VLLAGRVSEQITFGRITTGAADDLSRVTAIARSMIHEYGMGTAIRSHQVLGDDFSVSESLRQIRDEEVQAVTDEAYRGAEELLVDHRDLLDEIAERLLDNEVIEREEIKEILSAYRSPSPEPRELGERRAGTPAEALVSEPPPEHRRRGA
jgi:cell division protease FtsH